MVWKIVALVYAFFCFYAVFDATSYATTFRIIGLAFYLGGLIGLFVFAFKKRFLSERFWRSFMVLYVGYTAIGLLLGVGTVIAAHGVRTYLVAIAMSLAFQFPIMLSLWRLSFPTSQPGLPRFGEAAAP
ncbi:MULTISPECIES: hypothetical protein [Bradyrhizobium]|uniref:Uncharacterized protein n=1 Tax=Bradyrhizobium elkanii TaxID=29448 RepID=A0A4U6RWL0_BRAEL|nr:MULTISPECIES: hypothetical protein [Bradyrhizobium]MTV12947.1 hypothetical protein [Bradyrhizobium sp. BR2003]TKV78861.1 hypothetical protein FDV58_24460 [Bradyrhizobium elkanii]